MGSTLPRSTFATGVLAPNRRAAVRAKDAPAGKERNERGFTVSPYRTVSLFHQSHRLRICSRGHLRGKILTENSETLQKRSLAFDRRRSENRGTVMRILVVEDETKVARALKEGLE